MKPSVRLLPGYLLALALAGVALTTGCMSEGMRGTTIYTDEYGRGGHAHERLNLWPLVYYRSPALSAMWPVFEKSPAFTAVRPLFTAYREPGSNGVYSVMWPLASFDRRSGDSRIFPFYWGRGYRVGLPLYWHMEDAYAPGVVTDALIPLWWCSRSPNGYSANVMWPVFQKKRLAYESGWRVWPVVGSYHAGVGNTASTYRFVAWPLGHQWADEGSGSRGSLLFPVYAALHDRERDVFLSLPVSFGERRDGERWQLVPPVFYRRSDATHRALFSLLAGAGGSVAGDRSWSYVVPFYYAANDGAKSTWLSLPFWRQRDGDKTSWVAPLALAGGGYRTNASSWWALGPLVHSARDSFGVTRHAIPFFYYSADAAKRLCLSPFWCSGASPSGRWQAVVPLFYRSATPTTQRTFTLLGGSSTDSERHSSMRYVVPLYYSRAEGTRYVWGSLLGWVTRDRDRTSWRVPLLLSGGDRSAGSSNWWGLAPLVHASRDASGVTRHAIPLFYYSAHGVHRACLSPLWCSGASPDSQWQCVPLLYLKRADARGERLLTPLYARSTARDGSGHWQAVVPLFYRSVTPGEQKTVTLLGGRSTDAEGRSTLIYPLLSGGRTRRDGSGYVWVVAPLFHASWNTNGVTSHLFPVYYRSAEDKRLYSPLVAQWSDGPQRENMLIPPLLSLYQRAPTRRDLWALGGLGHASWGTDHGSQHVIPLFYRDAARGVFVSPVVSRWIRAKGGQCTVIPAALSWMTTAPTRRDLWALGGLGHASWGTDHGSQHVIPLFYRDAARGVFLSPVVSRWTRADGGQRTVVPVALSWLTEGPERRDLWLLVPMAHASWGRRPGASHVVPFYYRDPERGVITPLAARWQADGRTNWVCPLLLSRYVRDGGKRHVDALLGLASESWGGGLPREGYALPLYLHENGMRTFYTLLLGWKRDADRGYVYPLTPLVGIRTGRHRGGWLFPLFSRDRDLDRGVTDGHVLWGTFHRGADEMHSSLLPIYGYRKFGQLAEEGSTGQVVRAHGRRFWCLPGCWSYDTTEPPTVAGGSVAHREQGSGVFPFWVSSRTVEGGQDESHLWVCGLLYDRLREVRAAGAEEPGRDHVRNRVLWRLWHYEREGADVSVDVFPGITYDRSGEESKSFSFLWRLFRYERSTAGRRMYVLFVPVVR